jgi:uncharacterized protein RhaS with RHS repeats
MDRYAGKRTTRRFEDAYQRVDEQVNAGRIEAEDARWQILSQTFRARHAREEWLRQGAPMRRASDRAS